jgi:hypothetical protein
LSELAWRTRDYFRRYVEEGRIKTLIWFLLASFAIAGIQWALSPPIASSWFPVHLTDKGYFILLFAFAFLWLAVITAGLIKCGWVGLLMLIPIKWGLFPVYLIVMFYWSCAAGHGCL